MRPLFLHLDDALAGQPALLAQGAEAGARRVAATDLGPALRLWSRPAALNALADRLRDQAPMAEPDLTFAGSGDFHHVTPLLLERAIKAQRAARVTVVHFDNHPDWVRFNNGMHCGSWVSRAARADRVTRLITVGVCSADIRRPDAKGVDLALIDEGRIELYAYQDPDGAASVRLSGREWPTIAAIGEAAFADLLMTRIETRAVYITIDKDVLRADDAVTNWDQGRTSFAFLAAMITRIAANHQLIGADVVGDWSRPNYGGAIIERLAKRGEALLDQPWRRPDAETAGRLNQAVNLRLLSLFTEADHVSGVRC